MSFSKCVKLIVVSWWHRCGEASGGEVQHDVADGKCALSEESTTQCGHFPHHVPLGTRGAQQLLVSQSQGRKGEARRLNETQAGLRGRQIHVCECHDQCMSHERCAPQSWQDKNHPWYLTWKSFLSGFPGDGLCKDPLLAIYPFCLLSSCSWCFQGLDHDPLTSYSKNHFSIQISPSVHQELNDGWCPCSFMNLMP